MGALIRSAGHDADSGLDGGLGGAPDSTIACICQEENRILITLDLDFAHIENYPPRDFHGIIVLRLVHQDRSSLLAIIPRVLELLKTEQISQRLWIVDERRTRIRGES